MQTFRSETCFAAGRWPLNPRIFSVFCRCKCVHLTWMSTHLIKTRSIAPPVRAPTHNYRPKQYGVDLKTMEVNYKNLQKQFHPDQYATRPLEEQRAAETASSELNRAYAELRDPLRRARYMVRAGGLSARIY